MGCGIVLVTWFRIESWKAMMGVKKGRGGR